MTSGRMLRRDASDELANGVAALELCVICANIKSIHT